MQGRLRRLPSDLENDLPEEWPEDIVLGEKGDEDETEAEGVHGSHGQTVSSVGTSGSGDGGTAKISGSAKARTPEWKKAYENRNQQPAVSGSSRLVEMFQTMRDQPVQTTLGPIPEDSETESQRKSDSGVEGTTTTQQAELVPAAESDANGSAGSESGSWDTTSGSTSQSQNVESPFKLFRNKYDTFTNAKVNGILSQLASDGSSTHGSVQDSIRGQSRRGQVAETGFRSGPRSGPATGRGTGPSTGPSTGPGTLTGRISMDDFRPQIRRTEMVGEETAPIAKHLSIEQLNARQEHHKQTEQYIKNAQDLFEQLAQSRNVALPDSSEQSIISDSDGSLRQGAETDPDQSLNELEYSLRQHNPEFSEDEQDQDQDQDRKHVAVQGDASDSMEQSFGDSVSGTASGVSTDDATLPRDSSKSRQFAAPAVPSRTHPGMQQIRPDKFQMATYGEMEYDEKEQRWRQKSDSSKFDSHTTKVPPPEEGEDPFLGIEDLADSTEEQPEPMPQHHSEAADTSAWGQSFQESTKSRVSFRSDDSFQDREFAKRVSSVQQLTIPDIEYTQDDDTDPMPETHDSRVTNNNQPADETQPNAGRRVSSCHSVLQEMVFTPVVNGKKKSVSVLLESPAVPAAADTRFGAASSTPREAASTHDAEANVTHQTNIDKSMVRVVTDRERENLNWEEITTLEIRGQDLETIATLDRICPKLTTIDASNNRLHVLKGLPAGAISVNVSNNMLTDIAAFDRLARLQRLDLANNNLKSLLGLSRLRHLTDLDVSGNLIESLDGLERLPRLERLAAAGNRLTAVDFGGEAWANVREIDLAHNAIGRVESLANLHSIRLLDLSGNRIRTIEFPQLKSLTRLRLSGNGCAADVGSLRALRELLFDANRELRGLERLRELRRLSVQDGSCAAFTAATWSYISDVEELKLSGNNFDTFPITVPFLSMRYLEMTNCNLRSLPPAVDTNLLNVRYLDLSFNKLQDLADLAHIPKLEKLFLYSNRFSALSPLLEGLSRLERLVALDLRANPLTAHLHPDVVSLPGLDPGLSDYARYRRSRRAEYRPALEQQESEFLHNIEQHSPDVYEKRQLYQGLSLQAVPTLRWFDGLRLSSADVADTLHHMDAMNL